MQPDADDHGTAGDQAGTRTMPPGAPARRRRPSGEPPPLPRPVSRGTQAAVALGAATLLFWAGMLLDPVLRLVTTVDLAVLELVERIRAAWLTGLAESAHALGSDWTVRVVAWVTLVLLVAFRRVQHLVVYLLLLLGVTAVNTVVATELARMRPTGVSVLGGWDGYAHPAVPVAGLAFVLVGVLHTLVPPGRWRRRGGWVAATAVAALVLARLYLGVDHPTDAAVALVTGAVLPTAAFRFLTPPEVFPISYHGGQRAHLDVGGERGRAIRGAVRTQLGLEVDRLEPFALAGSAGSTPLRMHVRPEPGASRFVFGKLYALSHLRSDRWYKLARTVLYGRLEDELPFNAVRRLVAYEDHMLRLLRDSDVRTAQPFGFVEITPEREYLLVTEFLEGAREIGEVPIDDAVIDDALGQVRRLWDAGLAHRDIKPSNVLVAADGVHLIDVAFGEARPTPWRQAVDLANMMLTLALHSDPERVYTRACRQFSADDVAEAFAATRGVTMPSQLRARMRADGRDLLERFRELAPERAPVSIQHWSLRRAALTLSLLAGVAGTLFLVALNLRLAGLL